MATSNKDAKLSVSALLAGIATFVLIFVLLIFASQLRLEIVGSQNADMLRRVVARHIDETFERPFDFNIVLVVDSKCSRCLEEASDFHEMVTGTAGFSFLVLDLGDNADSVFPPPSIVQKFPDMDIAPRLEGQAWFLSMMNGHVVNCSPVSVD